MTGPEADKLTDLIEALVDAVEAHAEARCVRRLLGAVSFGPAPTTQSTVGEMETCAQTHYRNALHAVKRELRALTVYPTTRGYADARGGERT